MFAEGKSHVPSDRLPACPAAADPAESFVVEVVYTGANPIFSLDCGELNLDHSGPEIAVLTNDGYVRIITPGTTPWPGVVVIADTDTAWGATSRATVAVGDLDPSVAGDEIASMSEAHLNVATRVWGDFWERVLILDSSPYLGSAWGARVGDYMPSHPGDEIFLIYEGILDTSDGMAFYFSNGMWWHDTVYQGVVGMDSAAGEFDTSNPGPEVIITTEMGPTYMLWEEPLPPDNLWPAFPSGTIRTSLAGFANWPMWTKLFPGPRSYLVHATIIRSWFPIFGNPVAPRSS